VAGRSFFSGFLHPLILLDSDKPAAAILAGAQVSLFFLVADPASDIKINPETVSFTTVGAEFRRHIYEPF
jgi:hypothetical protein